MTTGAWYIIAWVTIPFILILIGAIIENWHDENSVARKLWDNIGTGIALTMIAGERLHDIATRKPKHRGSRWTPSGRRGNCVEHLRLNGDRWECNNDSRGPR